MSNCICSPEIKNGYRYVEWIGYYFGDCVYTPLDKISFICGLLSIGFYFVAFLPQLYENFKRKSVKGLSLSLFISWTFGDLFNYLGTILTQQLPTQKYTGAYFIFVDVVIVIQFLYYLFKAKRKENQYQLLISNNALDQSYNTFNDDSEIKSSPKLLLNKNNLYISSINTKKEALINSQQSSASELTPSTTIETTIIEDVDTDSSSLSLVNPLQHPNSNHRYTNQYNEKNEKENIFENIYENKGKAYNVSNYPEYNFATVNSNSKSISTSSTKNKSELSTNLCRKSNIKYNINTLRNMYNYKYNHNNNTYNNYNNNRNYNIIQNNNNGNSHDDSRKSLYSVSLSSSLSSSSSSSSSYITFGKKKANFKHLSLTLLCLSLLLNVVTFSSNENNGVMVLGKSISPKNLFSEEHNNNNRITIQERPNEMIEKFQKNISSPVVQPPSCNESVKIGPIASAFGKWMAWCSGILYFYSRFPQIKENYKNQSIEGLSIFLFICTICGNVLYGIGILCRFPPMDTKFFNSTLPYLIGSIGTLIFDIIICLQGYKYQKKIN